MKPVLISQKTVEFVLMSELIIQSVVVLSVSLINHKPQNVLDVQKDVKLVPPVTVVLPVLQAESIL